MSTPSAKADSGSQGEEPSPQSTASAARSAVARGVFSDVPPAAEAPSAVTPSTLEPPGARGTARAQVPSETPSPEAEGAVLVTGICGRLGRLLARELHRDDRVVGVDRRPFPERPKDVVHHQVDMRRKKMKDIFRGRNIRAVVHMGVLHDPRRSERERHTWNIVGFQKLLDYVTQYDVPKLVVLSGADVYGPQPNNPQFLTEDAPLLGAQHFGGIRDLVELDMLAQKFFWQHPQTETVILRPCHIVGRVRNAASNYLRLERPVTIMGFDPMVQIIHEKDVIRAIRLALRPGVRGIFNVRGPGEMPLSNVIRAAGGRPRPVPSPLARLTIDQLWRLRLSSFPSQELDHLRYVCMVDDTAARQALGYEPKHSLEEALAELRSTRHFEPRW